MDHSRLNFYKNYNNNNKLKINPNTIYIDFFKKNTSKNKELQNLTTLLIYNGINHKYSKKKIFIKKNLFISKINKKIIKSNFNKSISNFYF